MSTHYRLYRYRVNKNFEFLNGLIKWYRFFIMLFYINFIYHERTVAYFLFSW